jgi:hypothetical protein
MCETECDDFDVRLQEEERQKEPCRRCNSIELTSLISPTFPSNRPTGFQRAMIFCGEVLACLWCQYLTQDMRQGIGDVRHRTRRHAAQHQSWYRIHVNTTTRTVFHNTLRNIGLFKQRVTESKNSSLWHNARIVPPSHLTLKMKAVRLFETSRINYQPDSANQKDWFLHTKPGLELTAQ